MLLNNLPEQGNIEKMINKRNIRNKITFSSEEMDKLNLKSTDQGITWTPIDEIDVEFTNTEIEFLNDMINTMSENNLISENMLDFILEIQSLCKKED